MINLKSNRETGRAMSQAVSRRLPNEAARVRAQVRSCEICGGQCGTRAGFLGVLQFPLPISFHRLLHTHHHLSSGTGAINQIAADVPSGLSHSTPRKNRETHI
jgi:hypothetical protein